MAISVLKGKAYSFRDGLSSFSGDYYVVGRALIPVRIDKVLGWRDPGVEKPPFTSLIAYIGLPAYQPIDEMTDTLLAWTNSSNDVFLIPVFGVEEILETTANERIPSIIEAPIYDEIYQILEDSSLLKVNEIQHGNVRVDKTLDWRDNATTEQPVFILSDVGICTPVNDSYVETSSALYNAPLFLMSKVYTWTVSGGGSTDGPPGPQGPRGFQGLQGPSSVFTGKILWNQGA